MKNFLKNHGEKIPFILALLCCLTYFPSLSSLFFFISAVFLAPFQKAKAFWEKYHVKSNLKIILFMVFFIGACCLTPTSSISTADSPDLENTQPVFAEQQVELEMDEPFVTTRQMGEQVDTIYALAVKFSKNYWNILKGHLDDSHADTNTNFTNIRKTCEDFKLYMPQFRDRLNDENLQDPNAAAYKSAAQMYISNLEAIANNMLLYLDNPTDTKASASYQQGINLIPDYEASITTERTQYLKLAGFTDEEIKTLFATTGYSDTEAPSSNETASQPSETSDSEAEPSDVAEESAPETSPAETTPEEETPTVDPASESTVSTPSEQSVSTSPMVYRTKSGSKYHDNPHCNGGTYFECTLDEALSRGLQPCKKCVR